MDCRIEENILWVRGKLDSSTSPDFETAIARLTASLVEQPPRAVLELSGIETLTSAPLRAMLTLAKRLHAAKGTVVLAAPSPIALEALKVSGFMRLQVFQMIASVGEIAPAQSRSPQPASIPEPMPEANPAPAPLPKTPPATPSAKAPLPSSPPPATAQAQRTPAASTVPSSSAKQAPPAGEPAPAPGLFRRVLGTLMFWKR